MYFVYSLCDPRRDGLPFYIGKGSGSRPQAHLNETYQSTGNRRKWCKIAAIRRAGLEPLVVIIEDQLTEQQAYDKEASLIAQHGRKGYEANGTLTNICVDNRPPSALGRVPTQETRRKIGDKQIGPLNHRFGKTWSDEEKEFRRQFNLENGIKPLDATGRIRSAETREKMSQASKGKAKSAAHCKAIGDARRGKSLGPCSPEKAQRIGEAQYRNYELISPEGKIYRVNTGGLKKLIIVFDFNYGGLMAAKSAGRKYKGWSIKQV